MNANKIKSAPFLHDNEIAANLHIDLLMGLISVMIVAIVQNGLRVLTISIISAFAAWAVETIGTIIKRSTEYSTIRSITMGLVISLLCPVTVPVWLPALASAISVLFVRVLLGKNYKLLFMTPVIGWLFMLSISPAAMTAYPEVRSFGAFPIFENVTEFTPTRSIAQMLQSNQTPNYTLADLLTGNYAGGMGTTCIFVILAVCVYFIFRKSMAWQVSLSMILTVTVFALLFDRTGSGLLLSVIYELTATSYIYVAVFVAGDIINAPMLTAAKIMFGALIGILTMVFRYIGLGEHCVVLALLIVNLLSELFDLLALRFQIKNTNKQLHTRSV